jgi:SAM-dependent methyltransferase
MGRDTSTLVARGYDEAAERYLERFASSRVRELWLRELMAALPRNARVLDLGCGAGLPVAGRLVAGGHRVTGLDGSVRQIQLARSNVPGGDFHHADMTTVDLPACAFDGIAAFYSITHIPAAEQGLLLRRITAWLRPGGIFVGSFGTGSAHDWSGEWLGTTMFFSQNDDVTSISLVQDAGLRIVRAETMKQDDEEAKFLWIVARKAFDEPSEPS